MSKDLHEVLRERARRREEEEAGGAPLPEDAAPSAPAAARRGPSERAAVGSEDDESPLAPLGRPIVLAALLFAFSLGVYLRPMIVVDAAEAPRSSAPSATADELRRLSSGGEPAGVGAATLPGAAPVAGAPRATAGLAADLMDPANRVTIQVVSYDDRASNEPYAEATVAHLLASGYRAIGPLRVKDNLVVLVEAAPRAADLAPLRDEIARLPDAAGRAGSFADALLRNIDDLVER